MDHQFSYGIVGQCLTFIGNFRHPKICDCKYSKKNTERKIFKKGDVIFWKGHVAICVNSKNLIHAYGPEKKVLVMSTQKTIERIKKTANLVIKKISSIKY